MSDTPQGDPEDELYRELIDAFVHSCREGSGQVSAKRIRDGVWDASASPSTMPTEAAMNALLQSLAPSQRETLAKLVADHFQTAVFGVVSHLSWKEVKPLDAAYEGAAFNDFIARLDDWPWPEDEERWR